MNPLAALQFLTVVPIPGARTPASGAVWFAIVGAAIGAGAGAIRIGAARILPIQIGALLALTFLVAITGALHEDGLADVADAYRAGRTRERILAILKDSRIGVYGAIAIVLSLLLRFETITHLANPIPALAAACGASRGAIVAFAKISQPLGDGLGRAFCSAISAPIAILAALQSAALPFLGGPRAGIAALCANAVAIVIARSYFHRRAGGITGDCLGATCQITEILTLLAFLWAESI